MHHFYNLGWRGQKKKKKKQRGKENYDEILAGRAVATSAHQSTCVTYPTLASWVSKVL